MLDFIVFCKKKFTDICVLLTFLMWFIILHEICMKNPINI